MLYGGQSGLSKLLQASYMLCNGQNGLSEALQASYTLCIGQNGHSEPLRPPTRFAVIKTDSPNLHRPHTRLAVVKTNFPNHYSPPTRFAIVKTNSPNNYTLCRDQSLECSNILPQASLHSLLSFLVFPSNLGAFQLVGKLLLSYLYQSHLNIIRLPTTDQYPFYQFSEQTARATHSSSNHHPPQ